MIEYSQFCFLTEWAKAKVLEQYAVQIGQRSDAGHCYELYQLGDYYVEHGVCVGNYITNDYYVFQDTELLAPYLTQINISELLRQ